jgi:hypothetical protein
MGGEAILMVLDRVIAASDLKINMACKLRSKGAANRSRRSNYTGMFLDGLLHGHLIGAVLKSLYRT